MNRQSWTNQEDQAIRALVKELGTDDWTNISEKLKEKYNIRKRTGKQCRERWYNHLNPDVNKKPWTNQQQTQLFDIHRRAGNKWKTMSKCFEGRTDNDIKNHFYSTLRRSLRRLNKFIGQKNSTTQMRQIKPSVLSTIMNYIYEQENCLQNNVFNSLKDLPYLIFQFSNYKPVKSKLKVEEDEQIKKKINFIFSLINSANLTYQNLKQFNRSQKFKKHTNSLSNEDQQEKMLEKQEIDFMKYLPKKTYNSSLPVETSPLKKPKEKTTKIIRKSEYSGIKVQIYEKQKIQKDLLHTDLMQEDINEHRQFFIKKQEESQPYIHNQRRQQNTFPPQLGHLRTRRISLQAHEDFMEDQSIGDVEQPSQVSGFYYSGNGLQNLIVVGKQIPIHAGQEKGPYDVKVQYHSSNQNIDELIQMNYQG